MRLHAVAIAIVTLGATLACQHSEDRYLTRSVAPNEVHGTWAMTPTGVDGLRYAGHTKHIAASDHAIVVRPDGSCLYRGFVDAMATSGPEEGFIVAECEWDVVNVGHQALTLRLKDPAASSLHFYFAEEKGNLLLWQYVGDPDAWKYVEFVKQSNEPQQARESS